MKKAFLLASILFVSVMSTACINNFAVQELNNKAKEFMDKGDYVSAIERLKSSVDLDRSVFETQYNLAVAYTKAEEYENAIKTYNDAIRLNSNFADAYYSLAVCEENLARDILSGNVIVNDDDSISRKDENEDDVKDEKLSGNAQKMLITHLNNAISDYGIYLDKCKSLNDKEYVEKKIKELQEIIDKNTVD